MSAEEIAALANTDHAEIWQAYYLARINSGEKFESHEIRKNLNLGMLGLSLGSYGKIDADKVVYELFRRLPYEVLLSNIDFWSEDGPIAYRVLAERDFDKFSDRLRSDLNDNFQSLVIASKLPEPAASGLFLFYPSSTDEKGESTKVNFLEGALSGLAMHAQNSDRELFLHFVEHKSSQIRLAAIRGLRRVGVLADTQLLLGVAGNDNREVATEAALAAITLSPSELGAAGYLLQSSKPELVKLALRSVLDCAPKKLWPLIEDRLYDEAESIRKAVCAYAVLKFGPKQLEKILVWYISKDRYFYNVVFFLDRILYARSRLSKFYRKEMEEFLN